MNADRWLGLIFLTFAAALAFVWVPLDTDSGIAEIVRRRLRVGDALGPTVAAGVIGLGALLAMVRPGEGPGLKARHLAWLGVLLGIFAVSLAVMRWAGPLAAELLGEGAYRPLRATAPWKYIGFIAGGALMVLAAHVAATGRLRIGAVVVAVLAALAIAMMYDLPFEDLLLPPNGDL